MKIIRRNLYIGKVGFNAMKQKELVNLIDTFDVTSESMYVTFSGAPIVAAAEKVSEIAELQNSASICACDGKPIQWVANLRGIPCERCGGPDIMHLILLNGLPKGTRHFFYGGTQETLDILRHQLSKNYPDIKIVGMYSPPFRKITYSEDLEIVKMINESSADYVWVGLGAPKQDYWMNEHVKRIKNCRLIGVGAAFNFFAGTVQRAPLPLQKMGFEWLYRLAKEPRHLWKRYLTCGPVFLFACLKDFGGIRNGK